MYYLWIVFSSIQHRRVCEKSEKSEGGRGHVLSVLHVRLVTPLCVTQNVS